MTIHLFDKHLSPSPLGAREAWRRAGGAAMLLALALPLFAQSPYISKVYEYRPAPGQFVNVIPAWEQGDTEADVLQKANDCLVGNAQEMITLGAWGGYVVFGFDHKVENRPGKMDLKVLGNAYFADSNPNPDASRRGGSSEPGIILVAEDANGNGLPDDPWYEIKGSECGKPETTADYRVTYHRPSADHVATPKDRYLTDTTHIRWSDNQGQTGYIVRNAFHAQDYYPGWITDNTMSFEGRRLADNYVDESGEGSYYVQYCYDYGYADNVPNTDSLSCINIDWAVDGDGTPAHLAGIDFVKVYTAVNQNCGWLGETSTEVLGATDLHLVGGDIDDPIATRIYLPTEASMASGRTQVYSLSGTRITRPIAGQLYIVRQGGRNRKVVWP